MAVNDPLGDMLTRIRNAQMRRRGKVTTPGSSLRQHVLDVLQAEGYIRGYSTTDHGNGRTEFDIELKYFDNAAGDPQDRPRVEARPPRLRRGRRHAARRQRPRRLDPVHAEGRDGGSRRARGSCRRRSALHCVLTALSRDRNWKLMSRVGKKPVAVPAGVTAKVEGQIVAIKGGKGELNFTAPHEVSVSSKAARSVTPHGEESARARCGAPRAPACRTSSPA